MLDIGWTELLVIAVILIVVVGPKDLPPMIRAFGKMTKRLRQTAGEFRAQFDEALREAELDDLKNSVNDIRSLNPANSIRETLNPLRQMGQDIKSDLERATRMTPPPVLQDGGEEEHSILPDLPTGPTEPPQELKPAPAVAAAASPAVAQSPATAVPVQAAPVAPVTPAPVVVEAPIKPPARRKQASPKTETVDVASAPAKAAPRKTATPKAKASVNPPEPVAAVEKKPRKTASTQAVAPKTAAKPRKTKSEDRA